MSSADLPGVEKSQDPADLLYRPMDNAKSGMTNWRDCFPEIIGRSQQMVKVLEVVSKVARTDSAVLILGESGTGKELIASSIHRLSPRSAKRFVPINCSAIPENLLESELFGHERGAFTGADRKRIGHFEIATQGTIFLDEIGDMPLNLQAKLLRVLQEKKFTPLGGSQSKEADVRIIAATNKNLERAVKRNEFRLDLYYRLNVLPVTLPPLRERSDDIQDLLDHFLENANRMQPVDQPCFFSDEVRRVLERFDWPGNIRQLINLIERLVVIKGGGRIDIEHLPQEYLESQQSAATEIAQQPEKLANQLMKSASEEVHYPENFGTLPANGINLTSFIENLENDYILQALERTNNNKNRAAKLLGLNRTTLVERIKKRKIVPLNTPPKEF